MDEAAVIRRVRERLDSVFDVQSIVLFGSRARGDATADSDYDVLVLANTDLPFIERQGRALQALGPRDFAIDLLVYTPSEASKASAVLGSAIYWAQREGRTVYAK